MLFRHPRSVLLIIFLLAGSSSPPDLFGQSAAIPRDEEGTGRGIVLRPNYPNPVSPETFIPFDLPSLLFEGGARVRVTIRITNFLNRVIAIPVAVDHPAGREARVFDLEYATPGPKTAYWDGKDIAGNLVRSGVYYLQLEVPGETTIIRKIIVDNPRRRRNVFPW